MRQSNFSLARIRPSMPSWTRSRERQALVLVAARVGGDQTQVGVDEQFLGVQVAALDSLGELDLLRGREQGVAARVREQLVDGLGDERVGRREIGALDRAVEPSAATAGGAVQRRSPPRARSCSGGLRIECCVEFLRLCLTWESF